MNIGREVNRYRMSRWVGWRAMAGLLLCMAGCNGVKNQQSGSILVVVIVDSTASATREKESWQSQFEKLLQAYLPDDAQIAFVRCDHHPEFIKHFKVEGTKEAREKIMKAFNEAWTPRPCGKDSQGNNQFCGTDVMGALEIAVTFATKPENSGFERKMIIGWTDLQADPCNVKGRTKAFRQPLRYKWDNERTKNIDIILHGVPLSLHEPLRQQWGAAFKELSLYAPGEAVDIEKHYKLQPEAEGL